MLHYFVKYMLTATGFEVTSVAGFMLFILVPGLTPHQNPILVPYQDGVGRINGGFVKPMLKVIW